MTDPKPKTAIVGNPERDNETNEPIIETRPDGQLTGYTVLDESERAKGYVRPVRDKYVHTKCGGVTTMGRALAETYARDPKFYGATMCATCRGHFVVAEFKWDGTDEVVGS